MANDLSKASSRAQVETYMSKAKAVAKLNATLTAKLIFSLDATASRQPAWDIAASLQAEMFQEAKGLNVQLVYFRGLDECRASNWMTQPDRLAKVMERIDCRAGRTQIEKVLTHAKRETERQKVQALVFVGDAYEEDPDVLVGAADDLGRLGVPVFMFQEGDDPEVEKVYREIARVTKGAYFRFDAGSVSQLGELLRAIAVYATGGQPALVARPSDGANKLLAAMRLLEAPKPTKPPKPQKG